MLGAALAAVVGLASGPRGALAAAVGGVVAVANLRVLRRLGAGAVARVESGANPGAVTGLLLAALVVKMTVLFAAVTVLLSALRPPLTPFVLGLAVFAAAAAFEGLRAGLAAPGAEV